MGIYQSSGRTRNPLGVVSVFVGIVGAAASVLLWAYRYDPEGPLVRSIASRLGPGFAFGDTLVLFAAIFGALAVISAIAVSVGGSTRASSVVATVLGVVALSYPVLIWFKVFTRPLIRHALP
ncbi:MAG: hypothetical protein ACXWDU_03900 [Actinomycetota bacterium]